MKSIIADFYPSKKSNLKAAGAYKPGMKVSFHTFIKFRSFDEEKDVKEILSSEENSVTEEAFAKLNNVQMINYVNPPMLNSRRIIEEHKKRLNLSPYSAYPSPTSSYTSPSTSSYKSTYTPSSSLYPSRSSHALDKSSPLNNRRYNNSYSVSSSSSSLPPTTPMSPTYTRRSVYASSSSFPLSHSSSTSSTPTYSRPHRFQSSLTSRFSGSPSSNYLR